MGKDLNGRELGPGIVQRKDGRYQIRFINRFGKRESLYATTLKEARKILEKAKYEDEKLLNPVQSKMTLDEWYETWITTCKKRCRDTTKHTYEIQYNRLREELGWRKLNNLNLIILQEAFNHLKSDSSRSDCKALLVDMLNRAMESNLIVQNPAFGIITTLDHEEKDEKRILSQEDINILLAVPKSESLQNLLIVALSTGLRIGELLGLTWDCIDFNKKEIKIEKTLVYLPNNGCAIYEFHPTKTAAGKRRIKMLRDVEEALKRQRLWKKVRGCTKKGTMRSQSLPVSGSDCLFRDIEFIYYEYSIYFDFISNKSVTCSRSKQE